MANFKITIFFAVVCCMAFVAANPAPKQHVATRQIAQGEGGFEQLEGNVDLKGSESIGYGYYGGYPGYYSGYPYGSYGYGSYYGGYPSYYRSHYGYGGYYL